MWWRDMMQPSQLVSVFCQPMAKEAETSDWGYKIAKILIELQQFAASLHLPLWRHSTKLSPHCHYQPGSVTKHFFAHYKNFGDVVLAKEVIRQSSAVWKKPHQPPLLLCVLCPLPPHWTFVAGQLAVNALFPFSPSEHWSNKPTPWCSDARISDLAISAVSAAPLFHFSSPSQCCPVCSYTALLVASPLLSSRKFCC